MMMFFCLSANVVFAQSNTRCFEKKYQDSLETHYAEHGAYRYSYNNPKWQTYLDSLIAICSNIANAYREKAIPNIKRGDWAAAMPLEDKTVALDAAHWMDYRAFLKAIFTKDYEGALLDFDAAERLHPQNFVMDHSYPFFKGLCYLGLGKFDQAAIFFEKDIAMQSSSKPHFNSLWYSGVAQFELKNYEKAQYFLKECLAQFENHPDANYYLGLIYALQHEKATALKYLNTAQQGIRSGYSHNEDNRYYANYPYEITIFEITQAIQQIEEKK